MLPATLVFPCDNKPLKTALKSILGVFIGGSDNTICTGQRHQLPPQTTSTAPQATAGHWAKISTAPATTMPIYIYSTCLSIEKSINWSKAQTVLKCSTKIISYSDKYQIIYYLSIIYFGILYYAIIYINNMIVLINVVFSHAYAHEDPPFFFQNAFHFKSQR